jgi:F-type H+-transporting ATPase subunit delta
MDSNISYHFAIALLRSARKTGEIEKVEQELGSIVKMMASERRVMYFLLHPLVPHGRKEEFLNQIAESKIVKQLMKILIETKNLGLTGEVHSQFSALVRDELGVIKARMKTAGKLGKEDEDKIRKALERFTGKQVDLEVSTDPGLLAGVWMRIGDRVIDNTLKTELKMVKERLVS